MSAFEELGLDSNLCELLEKNRIELPTAIQQESIPLILGGGDLCACAETGTGKTLSFILSSLQIVHELFRNIGTYELKSDDNSITNGKCGPSDCDQKDTGRKKKNIFTLKPMNNYNSRVEVDNNTYECVCSSNTKTNSFEEIKIDCEIRNGMYAFEVEIIENSFVNVGFCPLVKETLKYNYTYCSNGCKYTNSRQEKYAESFSKNDVITCLINKKTNTIAFKKNGVFLGNAFKMFYKYDDLPFFPYICGKYFHVKFHFENLKYVDTTYYSELGEICSVGKEDNFGRKIYFDTSQDGDKYNLHRDTSKGDTCRISNIGSIGDGGNFSLGCSIGNRVEEENRKKLFCIVLCPTKDLAMQTYNNYLLYSECFGESNINIGLLVGGENHGRDKRNHRPYNIIVCTCYKLMESIRKNTINMNDIKLLILDEADELICNDENSVLLIKDACIKYSQHVQTCFFSATLQDENVKDCISKITNKPLYVDLKYGKNSIPSHIYVCIYYVKNVEDYYLHGQKEYEKKENCYRDIIYNEKISSMNYEQLYEYTDKVHLLNCKNNEKEKISLNIKINKLIKLVHIINVFNMQNGIIFCRTNLDCDNLYNLLNHVGDGKAYKGTVETMKENKYSCVILKGKMSNEERKNNLNAFKKGEVRFLICTDIAARGIDIQNVRYLIIMTLSENINTFFHKIGRVGRDGKNSLCIILSSQNDEEKVWYHTCSSRGLNCYRRNLKENNGCTVYIKESDYIKTINDLLETPMHVLDSKYYYVENVVDPLNYLKTNPVTKKSRRNKNQNTSTIFSDAAHSDMLSNFSSNIHYIKKLQSAISHRHYQLVNFPV
ncbi:ATP-dependent RNA helicase DDX1, putative [Plasmodium ovale]|nr:ATP-dependent RNA helicase DDX1, putative [Plasmodium ovale]